MLTKDAQQVCERRYFQKDKDGNVNEKWEDLANRVVNHVGKNDTEEFREKAYQIILDTEFLPNSPCLANAGTSTKSRGIMACFVSKTPADCWSDANETGMVENIANFGHIARQGGGAGVDFSLIRPEGDKVFGSIHAKACGPIEHMRMISEVMSSITQSGFRSMAMMGCLRIDHPDIEKFIVCKQRNNALKSLLKEDMFNHYEALKDKSHEHLNIVLDKFIHNFNISVFITNEFMTKVENDEEYDLVFNDKVYKTLKARKVFDMIVENAWKNGDPGVLFYDAINDSPYKYSGQEITATNPCSEEPLPEYGSCNLGSIDVSKFYNEKRECYEWIRLRSAIEISVQFLDNVVDINIFPTNYFSKWAKQNRPVGLGIMGWADLLLKMGITYGDNESLKFAHKLGKFFQEISHNKSVELGKERGTPKTCRYDELEHRRNVTILTIAPTGTISIIAGCSSSIEPIFSSTIHRYDNTGYKEIKHPMANKKHFKCASDLTWKQHVDIQAVFQSYIDASISKTANLPNNATIQDVFGTYMYAYKNKCKGITIYRDGCKTTQVLNTTKQSVIGANHAKVRPQEMPADVFKTTANGFDWHVIVGKLDEIPYEVFAVNGKMDLPSTARIIKRKRRHYSLVNTDNDDVLIENIGEEERTIHPQISLETRRFSLELRHNIDPKYIVEQIDKSNDVVTSFSKAVGRIMKNKYISADELTSVIDVMCPDCARNGKQTSMISDSSCWNCPVCYFSRCG